MRLSGKNVLVIGVGAGLGSATVYLLLKEGANVVMAARQEDKLVRIEKELSRYGSISHISGDASTMEGAAQIVKSAAQKMKRIDGLALLMGGYIESPVEALAADQMDAMIAANLKAPLYCLTSALPFLQSGSSVVMVSSIFGTYKTGLKLVAYSSAKAGVTKATEELANELADRGIRVNSVAPKAMRRDFVAERDWYKERRLGDRDCPPEDVASVIVWLMTKEADWVSGAVIPVDGGSRR
jgi:3-oxoacyl-[acyl-carrier protein] reductase